MKHRMRCVIVGASTALDHGFSAACVDSGDYLVCADGGLNIAAAAGVTPDLAVGDFDSALSVPEGIRVVRVKAEKDDTDSFLAVLEGLKAGCDEFVLYGCLGGRIEHTLANFTLLKYLLDRDVPALMLDAHTRVRMTKNRMVLPRRENCYVSIVPYDGPATGVTLRGLKYPLTDWTLTGDITRGISNEFAADEAVISLKTGTLLVIETDKTV